MLYKIPKISSDHYLLDAKGIMQNFQPFSCNHFLINQGFLPRPSRRRPNIDRAPANSPYAYELIAKMILKKCGYITYKQANIYDGSLDIVR